MSRSPASLTRRSPLPDTDVVTTGLLRAWPLPSPGGDKEARGRALIVGGSADTPGAILLAAEAALRAGAGKLQVATVATMAPHVAVAMPEALVIALPQADDGGIAASASSRLRELVAEAAAVLVGPGMVGERQSIELLHEVIPHVAGILVVDAFGLAVVTQDASSVHPLAGRCVLTPNLNELAITLGRDDAAVAQNVPGATAELAARTSSVATSGGAISFTASPDGRLWRDDHGVDGLGVSGSGDVLAGVICGLAARGAGPEQAAVWGSYVHKRAGERLAASIGPVGFLARELAREVPGVLNDPSLAGG